MIVVKLMGGIGNQMFQYATGRSLALRNNSQLKIDISWFNSSEKSRKYDLSIFNIIEQFSSASDYNEFRSKEASRFNRLAKRVFPSLAYEIINETYFGFDERIYNSKGNLFLDGYWQSEKYFLRHENVIRKEFTVKREMEGLNLSLCEDMKNDESVSIHVRRGDYVSNPSFNKMHGVLPISYYRNATTLVASRVTNPTFYVFSDDPQWVKQNLQLDHPVVYVDHNDDTTNYEDLRLMSCCKHHVIANSSFSWWGAWLNPSPQKIVVAPTAWFAKDDSNRFTGDLIPERWVRI